MAVPVKEDEGLVGEAVRGVIYFEGRTTEDCLRTLALAVRQITNGHHLGNCYMRDETREGEVGFYSFEVDEEGGTGDGN